MKVLVAPLDWGLGHATRCIPIIRELIAQNAEVIIAADGATASLLKKEFPQLEFIFLKGYHVRYSSFFPLWLMMFFQTPKIFLRIYLEHLQLKKIIRQKNIDAVISDNRFGLWNRKIKSVYITHQLMIKCPRGMKVWEPIFHRLHQYFISKYSECWIPDFEGEENLSGDLAHRYPLPANAEFIGALSRFGNSAEEKTEYEIAAIISGPEPSRGEFEKKIISELKKYSVKSIVISGKPEENSEKDFGTVKVVSHLSSTELENVLRKSNLIICRSGYSTVMDLAALKKNAVLIPTAGQTEQEYLGKYLSENKIFYSIAQEKFELNDALYQSKKFSVENFKNETKSRELLRLQIQKLKTF